MLRRFFVSLIVLTFGVAGAVEPPEVLLWPHGAPGSDGKTGDEVVETTASGERNISNVHKPSLTPYLPNPEKATGVAIVIAPGGGHSKLCVDHEGHNLARWLSDHGVASFVLKYRLCREKESTYQLEEHAVVDMQRAIRMVRHRAAEWNVDPVRVGALGFSAGGELAFLAAMKQGAGDAAAADDVEKLSGRPDFQCLIYPGKSNLINVAKDTPQAFIVCGYGDRKDISHGMAEAYLKFKEAGVKAELHIYSAAGHGFGVRDSAKGAAARWPHRLEEWLLDNVPRPQVPGSASGQK